MSELWRPGGFQNTYMLINTNHDENKKQLPNGIQNIFQLKESKFSLRGTNMFVRPAVRTNTKLHCISARVQFWNSCSD